MVRLAGCAEEMQYIGLIPCCFLRRFTRWV